MHAFCRQGRKNSNYPYVCYADEKRKELRLGGERLEDFFEFYCQHAQTEDLHVCEPINPQLTMLRIPFDFKFSTSHVAYSNIKEEQDANVGCIGTRALNSLVLTISEQVNSLIELPDGCETYLTVSTVISDIVETEELARQMYLFTFHYLFLPLDVIRQKFFPKILQALDESDILSKFSIPFRGTWKKALAHNYIEGEVPLLGSSKPGYLPFRYTTIGRLYTGEETVDTIQLDSLLSVRNLGPVQRNDCQLENLVSASEDNESEEWEEACQQYLPLFFLDSHYAVEIDYDGKKVVESVSIEREFGAPREEDEREELPTDRARFLLQLCGIKRWTNVCHWSAIGKALHHVFNGSEEGLQLWVDSTQAKIGDVLHTLPQFRTIENIEVFMRDVYHEQRIYQDPNNPKEFINEQTLEWFAREDNPQEYTIWFRQILLRKVEDALSCLDLDISECIAWYIHLTNIYSADGKTGIWYYYNGYIWVQDDEALHLRATINRVVIPVIAKLLTDVTRRLRNTAASDNETARTQKLITGLNNLIAKIKTLNKSLTYIRGMQSILKVPHFASICNANPRLTNTGEYTLEIWRDVCYARSTRPQDYHTRITGVAYNPKITPDDPGLKMYHKILKQYYPDPDERMLFRKIVASGLYKANRDKVLLVFVGENGDEAKSTIVSILSRVFGRSDVIRSETTLITGKKGAAGAATPHIGRTANTRWLIMDEADAHMETIRIGLLKLLTGGSDKLTNRGMYSSKMEDIEITFVPILVTNSMIPVQHPDLPTIKRIIFVHHQTVFLNPRKCSPGDIPATKKEQRRLRIYPADTEFEEKTIPFICAAVLWQAVEDYPLYVGQGYTNLPASSLKYAREYWMRNDRCLLYFQEHVCNAYIHKKDGDDVRDLTRRIRVDAVYADFLRWYKRSFPQLTIPTLEIFTDRITKHYSVPPSKGFWYGIRLKTDDDMEDTSNPHFNESPQPTHAVSDAERRAMLERNREMLSNAVVENY